MGNKIVKQLTKYVTEIISETNGITLSDTLDLACSAEFALENPTIYKPFNEFRKLIAGFQQNEVEISTLLNHPLSEAFKNFFKNFPLPYREEHIHLTGSLTADFVYPRLKPLLEGPHKDIYWKKIRDTYGEDVQINDVDDVEDLLSLKENEKFDRYLEILLLPKLILTDREAHRAAAFHMASELYHSYNVGFIRLKFTFSRATTNESEQIPGSDKITEEDVVMGLYDGFMEFKKEFPTSHSFYLLVLEKKLTFLMIQNSLIKKNILIIRLIKS